MSNKKIVFDVSKLNFIFKASIFRSLQLSI